MKETRLDFFGGGDDFKTGGECIIVVINQDSGGGSWNRGRCRDGGSWGEEEQWEVHGLEDPKCYGAIPLDIGGW